MSVSSICCLGRAVHDLTEDFILLVGGGGHGFISPADVGFFHHHAGGGEPDLNVHIVSRFVQFVGSFVADHAVVGG